MKSHFTFTKQQRNGIFLLLVLIVLLQCLYFFVDLPAENIQVDPNKLAGFLSEIDSLKHVEKERAKPKIYPFNPNYLTDFKGANLGMSNIEIDRLLHYRRQGKWINSPEQFQEVTQISDSLLQAISPYFKFPDWVKRSTSSFSVGGKALKQDLNKATAQQLEEINGVGKVLAKRIIKYRDQYIGGFVADIQLNDVYGLTPEIVTKITERFTVKTPSKVKKVNLNSATVAQLVTIPYIDYDLAAEIIEQRKLWEGFKSIDELKKVNNFPSNKIEIIKLYLHLEKQIDE